MPEQQQLKGKLLHTYGRIRVFEGFPYNLYEIEPLSLTDKEQKLADVFQAVILRKSPISAVLSAVGSKHKGLIERFNSEIIQTIDVNELIRKLPSQEQYQQLLDSLTGIAAKLVVGKPKEFAKLVLDKSIGYRELSEPMSDPNLEEVMVNGDSRNVFVFHKKAGNCKTSIKIEGRAAVLELIRRIAATGDKQFGPSYPLLDARLPDGSRANATSDYVSPFGATLTIRKFSRVPLSIVDLIANKTLSSQLAAFLWAMVEGMGVYPMNVIITGGAGTGKTTLMNILAMFVPFSERIVSIEDTIELDLGTRLNWVQMESRPKIREMLPVSMDDLLKNTLRMRPDRILVGEVRGEEAQTLFVAMDTGHRGILGTLHSNTARELLLRLKSGPMNVPEQMLPLLDLIVVMQRHYDKKEGILRRIKHVAEVGRMQDTVLQSNIFELDSRKDEVERTNIPSEVVESLAQKAGMTKNQLRREMFIRQRILDWMLENSIREIDKVEWLIQQYYFDPESVLKEIASRV